MKLSKKRSGFGLEVKTVEGKNGTYLFFRAKNGSYHTFLEVAAKDAARDCGATDEGNTRQMCKEVWDRS